MPKTDRKTTSETEPDYAVRLATIEMTAEQLGLSPRQVQRLIRAGDLPVVRIGRSVRIDPADTAALIRRNKRVG